MAAWDFTTNVRSSIQSIIVAANLTGHEPCAACDEFEWVTIQEASFYREMTEDEVPF